MCIIASAGTFLGCSSEAPQAGPSTIAIHIPDMMCAEGCGAKVEEILSEQPGANRVRVDFESKSASVVGEPGVFDPQAAIDALVDHGFDNSTIAANPAYLPQPGTATPQ